MYTAKGRLDANAMLKQYSPLVRRLAHQMIAKLPANVELDDLIQVGMIGLSDAMTRFDAAQGVQFETFATQRIRGAMLDELRGNDWMSRGDRRQQRSDRIGGAQARAAPRPRAERRRDRRARWGWRLVDYQELLGKVRGTQLVYLEDMSGDDGDDDYLDRHVAERGRQSAGAAAGPAHAPGAGRRDQEPARARAVRDEHVLRARHEPEGDRGGARRHREPRLPAAQPVDRAAAREAARVVTSGVPGLSRARRGRRRPAPPAGPRLRRWPA